MSPPPASHVTPPGRGPPMPARARGSPTRRSSAWYRFRPTLRPSCSRNLRVVAPARRRLESGQVLVIFAVASVAIFGIVALAIDGGRILMDQRTLQFAFDGAATT